LDHEHDFGFCRDFCGNIHKDFSGLQIKLIRALVRGEDAHWNHRYSASSIFALAYGLISTMILIPAIALPEDPISLLFTFLTSFFYGWGINDAFNKIFIDWTKCWKMVRP
jgi:hypothetical protein